MATFAPVFSVLSVLMLAASLVGQQLGFGFGVGGSGADIANAITVDAQGDTYICGTFGESGDFDPGVGVATLTSYGLQDAFVAKYSRTSRLIWAKSFGDASVEEALKIAVDASGSIFVLGKFFDTTQLDPQALAPLVTGAGRTDFFLAKYDEDLALQWAFVSGGPNDDYPTGFAISPEGDIVIVGTFTGTAVDLDPGAGTAFVTSNGSTDVFMVKISASGQFQWAKSFGGIRADAPNGVTFVEDRLLVYGEFSETVDFDPSSTESFSMTTSGRLDGFFAAYDTDGLFLWSKQVGGAEDDAVNAVKISSGSIFAVGYFTTAADLDPGDVVDEYISAGNRDVFIMRLDPDAALEWVHTFGGTSYEECFGIDVDTTGMVYVAGHFNDNLDADPGPAHTGFSSDRDSDDVFVSAFSTDGSYQWSRVFGGRGQDRCQGLAVDSTGLVTLGGLFREYGDFDPGPTKLKLSSAGSEDAFVIKLVPDVPVDQDSLLVAGGTPEPSSLDSVAAAEETTPVLDVIVQDGGSSDLMPTGIVSLAFRVSGSADASEHAWELSADGFETLVGVVEGATGAQRIVFADVGANVFDGTSVTFVLNVVLAPRPQGTHDGDTLLIELYPDDIEVVGSRFTTGQSPVTNHPGAHYAVLATELRLTNFPQGPLKIGRSYDFAVRYTDAAGNLDRDVSGDEVTITRSDNDMVVAQLLVDDGQALFSKVRIGDPPAPNLTLRIGDDPGGTIDLSAQIFSQAAVLRAGDDDLDNDEKKLFACSLQRDFGGRHLPCAVFFLVVLWLCARQPWVNYCGLLKAIRTIFLPCKTYQSFICHIGLLRSRSRPQAQQTLPASK